MTKLTLILSLLLLLTTLSFAQQSFQNVTSSMGISGQTGLGHAVGWGDIDNDGYTDLLSVSNDNFSILYNNGDATFQPAQIISPYESFWGVAVLDYDRDGYIDIYHTTYSDQPNMLLHNNGDGTFTNSGRA